MIAFPGSPTLFASLLEAALSLSSDEGGGEGRGEELCLLGFPLSSILSPLVPRGERKSHGTFAGILMCLP